MIYAVLPLGVAHGWGICGRYLSRELASLEEVRLITDRCDLSVVGDELELRHLAGLRPAPEETARLEAPEGCTVDAPVLQSIGDNRTLLPGKPQLRGRRNVGYAFFEENILPSQAIDNARASFDVLAAGSSWCADVLRGYGLTHVATVLQGVDGDIFQPRLEPRQLLPDQFIVFSGGKLEFRKGQDLVIRAFKVLQDRHPDVILVNQWYNPWEGSVGTMAASPYIRFVPTSTDHTTRINQVLADNGIDLARTITLQPRHNSLMAHIYRNTDVGLFPNRCEGGTNLVLMEYMACGRPAVASYTSGHKDVLNERNAVLIKTMGQLTIQRDAGPVAVWDDPNLDETVERLEWAYQQRDSLRKLGQQAGRDLAKLTWHRAATEFHSLLSAG